jgi:Bacteriophage probable baseplate hub protein
VISRRDAPAYYVKVAPPGGHAQAIDLTEPVISVTFDEEESKADKLELELDNFDLSLFDDPHWKHGNTLVVSWGYVGNMSKPRSMVVGKITGAKVLKVEALAPSILMNKEHKSRCFERMTPCDIANAIGKEYGIPVAEKLWQEANNMQDPAAKQTTQQAKMTDAQMLAHLAKRHGYVFHVKDDGIHFAPRNVTAAPTRVFHYYTDPEQGDVLDFNVENDVTMAPGRIVAKGRDPLKKEDIHEGASNKETERGGMAPITHTVSRRDLTTQTVSIAQDAVLLTTAPTAAIAKRQVDGKYIRAQQATVQLTLSVIGDPNVGAAQVIEVRGISKRLSGKYYVKSAKHKLTATSYVLDLTCHSDGSHGSPAAVGARSDASLNTKPPEEHEKLKPVTVFVDGRTLTTYRK